MAQLFVGIMAEGPTDYLFLRPIVEKTITDIIFVEVSFEVEVSVFEIRYRKEGKYADYVLDAARNGTNQFGIMSLIVHADADAKTNHQTYRDRINPAFAHINNLDNIELCKEFVAMIPIYETESWMLANKQIFKNQIGTKKTDGELDIDGHPETFSRPKEKIEEAIRRGREVLPKKVRYNMTISDLYAILGDVLTVSDLESFTSYRDFQMNVRTMLIHLSFIPTSISL